LSNIRNTIFDYQQVRVIIEFWCGCPAYEAFGIDRNNPDICIGDKAPDGSQIRPYVIFFNEEIDKRLWRASVEATKAADVFIVVGSTMLVYPAAGLLKMIPPGCKLYVIDPEEVALPEGCNRKYIHI